MLEIKGLRVAYMAGTDNIEVVRGIDLEIRKGECVGLVGESGCGKTTLGLSITRLIPERKSRIISGSIFFEGRDILTLDSEELRGIRGKRISYVFQDPFSSLNPVLRIYDQVKECLLEKGDADAAIYRILERVGLPEIAGNKRIYPHELSGGMQQRVMIAMAVAQRPGLVVLDEPLTALDATVQSQILELISELKKRMGLSILFISHDLRTVFRLSDTVAVMYAGNIVEQGSRDGLFIMPRHPYTIGLVESMPSLERRRRQHFNAIEGKAPLFSNLPKGCKFYPRCKFRLDRCTEREPLLEEIGDGHSSRCIRAKELTAGGINKGM